jgi:hypothetical protein
MAAAMSEGQMGMFEIIAVLTNRSVTTSVRDSAMVQLTGLPAKEMYMIILINYKVWAIS